MNQHPPAQPKAGGVVYPSTYRKRLYGGGGGGLTGPDVAILGTLAFLAEQAKSSGWFTVTQKEIAERSGQSMDTVGRRLPGLELRGWVEIRQTGRNGHYQASAYRLRLPPHTAESGTVHTAESGTVHTAESGSLTRRERQRLRSKSLQTVETARPHAATAPTSHAKPETEAPPAPARPEAGPDGAQPVTGPAIAPLLDELGIRRAARQAHA